MGCIYKRGGVWWLKYYRAGEAIRESSRSRRKGDATHLLHIREGHLAEGRPFTPIAQRLRFEDLKAELLNDYRSRGLRTIGRREEHLTHLAEDFTGWRAQEITTAAIRTYTARRQQEGAANATINRELAALKRAFNLAIQAGKLWHRPHVPMLREANARQGFFEVEMFEAVRAQLPDYLYGVITFGYYTGWRKGEILSLRWQQVNLAHNEVRLEPGTTKNHDGRVIFLDGELREILERQWECRRSGCDHVFHRHGRRIGDFEKSWARACKRAAQAMREQEEKRLGAQRPQNTLPRCIGLLFHDLRRTAVRNLIRAGVPERVAMQITGHKTRAILDRYHIVSEGDLREAAWKLAAWSSAVTVEPARDGHNSGTLPIGAGVSMHANLIRTNTTGA
jgi:integrase